MKGLHSYGTIYNLGHRAVHELLSWPVVVQEKIDGSQFSFGVTEVNVSRGYAGEPPPDPFGVTEVNVSRGYAGEPPPDPILERILVMRSKGAQIFPGTKDKLFGPAIATAQALFQEGKLTPGWTYRGEAVTKPKHNTLAYDRIPIGGVILFDIDAGEEDYFQRPATVAENAAYLGLETVPTVFEGVVTSLDQVHGFLDRVSVLGGSKIEGVVLKAYGHYGPDKKTLMAKYVSEAFKEVHGVDWKSRNPVSGDIILKLIERLRTPARWNKAVQHLQERGELQDAPQDIGPLMREVALDVLKEEREMITHELFTYAWPKIQRGIAAGLPQWYKDQLAAVAFAPTTVAEIADPRPVLQEAP